jgi:predicted ribosomally synthesized peptide with SipW-like signal peptide
MKMTKTKSTKRALLVSLLALLTCVSMLVGSTFAWFTDSVTSAGNKIQSGTLDVDLVDAAGNSMADKVINFKTADNRAQDQILWEPGCTYNTEKFFVKNTGNLHLKFKVLINGIEGDAKLLEAIEFTLNGAAIQETEYPLAPDATSGAFVLTGHMKEEAGNEYQGLTVEGIAISVFATQETYEKDSFNDQYDKGAAWDGTIPSAKPDSLVVDTAAKLISINDADAFAYLNTLLNDGNFTANYGAKRQYAFELNCEINLLGNEWTPIVMSNFVGYDSKGHTISYLRVSSGAD